MPDPTGSPTTVREPDTSPEGEVATTPPGGLSEAEAADRRARGLNNAAPPGTGRSYARIFFDNLFTLIHIILLGIATVLIALGFFGDALVTAGLVVANVTVGVFQEARAKRKLDRVALLLRPEARVVRDGQERVIDPVEVVLGDLLIAGPGDQFLVDGEVASDGVASVDESLLTGESDLVTKRAGDPVYSGSYCMTGSVRYVATRVGPASTANQMTAGAREYRNVRTPLQREVALIIQVMFVMALALAFQVANQYRQGELDLAFGESVRAAAVIFGLVPQGLVFMVTVTYAMAAVRLAGRGLLIQRMNAVESTSHIDVLCLDKTGTLTTNRLRLEQMTGWKVEENELRRLLGCFVASAGTQNRTAQAIAASCPAAALPLRAEVPFSSERKWSALSYAGGEPPGTFVLGAPDVLALAVELPESLERALDVWTAQGLRVLTFARSPNEIDAGAPVEPAPLPEPLEVLGLIALSDELRPDVQETIDHFEEAGITPKIISGDHPGAVSVLALQAGIEGAAAPVSGLELDELSDYELGEVANDASVFGRITPEQKERLVEALNRRGHYVAMIGDGVNDVLALKRSHVAVALRSGSQVTRNVADLVLMDDAFGALPRAFQEGQRILRGMEAIIRLFLTRGFYIGLIIIGASLLGYPFPSTPKLDTLLALLTIGVPILALATWATPGPTPKRILRSASHFVVPAALITAVFGLAIYAAAYELSGDLFVARTVLVTTTVLCGIILVPFVHPPVRYFAVVEDVSGEWRPSLVAASMVLLYLLILVVPPLREFYELKILPAVAYVAILAAVGLWLIVLRFVWSLRLVARATAFLRRRFPRLSL
jgi:cation-transporting P-type ATPase E